MCERVARDVFVLLEERRTIMIVHVGCLLDGFCLDEVELLLMHLPIAAGGSN